MAVQTRRATGGEPGARIVYLSGGGDRCPVWRSLSGPGKRVGVVSRANTRWRGADDSDGGVSLTRRAGWPARVAVFAYRGLRIGLP